MACQMMSGCVSLTEQWVSPLNGRRTESAAPVSTMLTVMGLVRGYSHSLLFSGAWDGRWTWLSGSSLSQATPLCSSAILSASGHSMVLQRLLSVYRAFLSVTCHCFLSQSSPFCYLSVTVLSFLLQHSLVSASDRSFLLHASPFTPSSLRVSLGATQASFCYRLFSFFFRPLLSTPAILLLLRAGALAPPLPHALQHLVEASTAVKWLTVHKELIVNKLH